MKESETVEFKKSLADLKAGLVSIAAILNKHGRGELWFGIRSDGKAVGLDATEKTLRDISQAVAAHIEPKIYPHVTLETMDGCACIKVAFEGHETPYYSRGRAYMRVADEDRQLSAKELEKLILVKNSDRLRWDNGICRLAVGDLDEGKLKRFVERAGLGWDTAANAVEKLGLRRDGKLLNAAPLFFAKTAPMELRCAVFGTTDSAMIIDRHDVQGDILELIEEAQKYVLKTIYIGMRLILKNEPHVQFKEIAGIFIVSFGRPSYSEEIAGANKAADKDGKASAKTSVKTSVKTSDRILSLMRENPDFTIPAMADKIGVTTRSIERNIKKLQQQGALKRVGPDKGGHWEVIG